MAGFMVLLLSGEFLVRGGVCPANVKFQLFRVLVYPFSFSFLSSKVLSNDIKNNMFILSYIYDKS